MHKKNDGFTLIEMIVVIVIIAILAAIAVPAVMRYIDDARDTRLITQAHSVLTRAQTKSIDLYAHGQLQKLDKNPDIWEEIVDEADVEGTLEELELNALKNSSGDFILAIGGKYVYYTDETQTFEIKDELINSASFIRKIKEALISESALSAIANYFATKDATSLDSEGINFGKPLKSELEKLGFNPERYSFRIEQDKNKTKHTITITEKHLTTDLEGNSITVTQFDYGAKSFQGEFVKKTGTAVVKVKNVEGKLVPYIETTDTEWTLEQ